MKLRKTIWKEENIWKDFVLNTIVTIAIFALWGLVAFALSGCDEGMNMVDDVITNPIDEPMTNGEMKQPEEPSEPGEPEKPIEPKKPEVPMVPIEEITAEVAYYNDAELTDNLAAALYADEWDPTFNRFSDGDTFYATVTFSHPLQVVEQAKPALFIELNSERIAQFTASADTLTSGTYKKQSNRNRYVCKYTVPADIFGHLQLTVELGERAITGEHSLQAMLSSVCIDDAVGKSTARSERSNNVDFVGRVLVPYLSFGTSINDNRDDPRPLEGVRVTIMAGQRAGESTLTNQDGEFVFPDIAADELHVRLEKACYETKEMLVSRSRPSALPDGTVLGYQSALRRNPGVILMGRAWPEPVRPILEQMVLPPDLLFIEDSFNGYAFYNVNGVVAATGTGKVIDQLLLVFAHEITHAWQHAAVAPDGSGDIFDWEHTPAGRAYAEAQRKDREAFGESDVDWHPIDPILIETSANTMEVFLWSITTNDADKVRREATSRYQNLKTKAPNRLKWAQEWYKK